ncbi:MAG: PIN domain-containing protein [Verrucomicrobiales bacterium]
MKYLADVNVLVAWGWADHEDHRRVARWIATLKTRRGTQLLTSAIPELGFVRVSVQRAAGRIEVEEAARTLASMLEVLGPHHGFLADDGDSTAGFPPWCTSAGRTTDAHLLCLAHTHGATLATLDEGIPGAFLIPD